MTIRKRWKNSMTARLQSMIDRTIIIIPISALGFQVLLLSSKPNNCIAINYVIRSLLTLQPNDPQFVDYQIMRPRPGSQTPQPPRKDLSPIPKTLTTSQRLKQPVPVNAKPLIRLLGSLFQRTELSAFVRLQSVPDPSRPKLLSASLQGRIFKRKIREFLMSGMYSMTRNIVRLSLKSQLPEPFRKDLEALRDLPKLEVELNKQVYRVGANTEKGGLLNTILTLFKRQKEESASNETLLSEIVNLAETIQKGGYDLKQLNMWYRTNLQRMTPEMKRFKNVLTKLQEIVAVNEKEKKSKGETEKKIKELEFKLYEESRKAINLERDLSDKVSPLTNELNTVAALISQKKFGHLKMENAKGRFPNLSELVENIVEYLDGFPAAMEFADTEQLASKAQLLFQRPKPMAFGDIQKFLIATEQSRIRLCSSQNKMTKQVAKIIRLLQRLCNAMNEIQEETSKKLTSRLEEESMINRNVDKELKRARGDMETLKDQMDKQKVSFEEEKEKSRLRYETILQNKESEIEGLTERIKLLQDQSQKHTHMLQAVKPKISEEQNHLTAGLLKPIAPKPPMRRTDSQIFIEPMSASTYQFQIDRLKKELEASGREVDRLNEVIHKLEESYQSYEQQTLQSREMIRKFKEKMAAAERLAEEREFGPLAVETNEMGVETGINGMVDSGHRDAAEAGRRLMELERSLSDLRDQHSQCREKIRDLEDRNQKLRNNNAKILLQRNQFQSQFEALEKQRKYQQSIVLSKRASFGKPIDSELERINKAFSQYSFAVSTGQHNEQHQPIQQQSDTSSKKFPFIRGGSNIVPRVNPMDTPTKQKQFDIQNLQKERLAHLKLIADYENSMNQYVEMIKIRENQLREMERKIEELQAYEGPLKQLAKAESRIYDLEYQVHESELDRIKLKNALDRLEKKLTIQTRSLTQLADEKANLKRQLRHVLKKMQKSGSNIKMQSSKFGKQQQKQEQLGTESDRQNELINLLKVQDLHIPHTPNEQSFKVINLIMSGLVDIFNGYISHLDRDQLQIQLERYLVVMEESNFKAMVNALFEFVRLAHKHPLQQQPVEEIKQKFVQAMGWEKLIPTIQSYVQNPTPESLTEIRSILGR